MSIATKLDFVIKCDRWPASTWFQCLLTASIKQFYFRIRRSNVHKYIEDGAGVRVCGIYSFSFCLFCNAGKFVVYLIIICGDKWHRVWCSTGALIVRGESQHVTFHRCHRCPTVALIQVINDLHSPLSPRALFCVSFVRLFVFVSFLDITHMT